MASLQELVTDLHAFSPARRVAALRGLALLGEHWAVDLDLDQRAAPLLDDPSVRVQEEALRALGAMGWRGSLHLDRIAKKLGSSQKQVQCAALQAIGSLGSYASQHTATVEGFLASMEPELVAAACSSLGSLRAEASAPRLAAQLHSGDAEVAEAACWALGSMDSGAEEIAKLLSSQEARVRSAAIGALRIMSTAENYAGAVAPLVADPDATVRGAAAELLNSLGCKLAKSSAATICPCGTKYLDDAVICKTCGIERPEAIAALLAKMLVDSDCGVVAAAATALGGMGEAAATSLAELEALLADGREDDSARMLAVAGLAPRAPASLRKPACAAAAALGALGSMAAAAAPQLAQCLGSGDWELRAEALRALGALGKAGAQHESKVLERLGDAVPVVVAAACAALGAFAASSGPSSTTAEAVADLLNSKQPQVRAAACRALGCMPGEAEAFLEVIIRLFSDGCTAVQEEAVRTVAGCGEAGQVYAGEVFRLASSGGVPARARRAALESLALMGERGRCFSQDLEVLWDDPEVGLAAQAALERLYSPPALPPAEEEPGEVLVHEEKKRPANEERTVDLGYDAAPPGPSLPAALLFPGQGSQYVNMLAEAKETSTVRAMLERAKVVLGYDLLQICLKGPEEKLEQTRICQPAMYIAGLAAVEELKKTKPDLVARKRAVAGLSLGEYTALTVAGVFDFETGLRLVKLRGEAMQEAAEASPQAMLSVAGLGREVLAKLCEESKTSSSDICSIANFLFPNGFSCAGSMQAIRNLEQRAQGEPGCLQAKRLKTSGAFHTEFMKPAKQRLMRALIEAEPSMRPPRCEVYMNVTGKKLAPGTPPAEIVDMLGNQLTSCVEWDASMKAMISDGIGEFYECGPMKQLKSMMKRINKDAWEATTNVSV